MKWFGPLLLVLIFVSLFFSLKKWYPDYFLIWQEQYYSVEDVPTISAKDIKEKPTWWISDRLYDFFISKICETQSCELDLISGSYGDSSEDAFYLEKPQDLESLKRKVAKEQYQFMLLKEQDIVINLDRDFLESKESWPWIGAKSPSWSIHIQLAKDHPVAPLMPNIIKRLVRDHSSLRIYFFTYQSNESIREDLEYNYCLREKRIFWKHYFAGDLWQQNCQSQKALGKDYYQTDKSLVINIMGRKLDYYSGYYEFIRILQPQFLQSKMKR